MFGAVEGTVVEARKLLLAVEELSVFTGDPDVIKDAVMAWYRYEPSFLCFKK